MGKNLIKQQRFFLVFIGDELLKVFDLAVKDDF
jgi:hypothetical protein